MRVMVTGASGLLGEEIADHFEAKDHEVIRLKGRKQLDLRDLEAVMHFVEDMDRMMIEKNPNTRLKMRRINCGMSQSELANESGVALRQIQLFEQRQRNINNAAASTLLRLSKVLFCKMEDLME